MRLFAGNPGRLLLCASLLWAVGVAPRTVTAQDVEKKEPAGESESLDVRFARAHLVLAKADLKRALELNKRFPNSVPLAALENYRKHVAIDEELLQQALEGSDGHVHKIYMRAAEISEQIAKDDLSRKRKTLKDFPSEMSELDVERAEAVLAVAQLNRMRTAKQEASLSSLEYLQWQIEQLRHELLELRVRVETDRDQ